MGIVAFKLNNKFSTKSLQNFLKILAQILDNALKHLYVTLLSICNLYVSGLTRKMKLTSIQGGNNTYGKSFYFK